MALDNIFKKTKKGIATLGLVGAIALGTASLNSCESLGKAFISAAVWGAGEEAGKEFIQNSQKEKYQRHLFACNHFNDLNSNRKPDYPEEFSGISNIFNEDDNILLVDYNPFSKRGQKWKMELYSPNRTLIGTDEQVIPQNGYANSSNLNVPSLISKFGYGNYSAVFFIGFMNTKEEGRTSFTIIDNLK